MVKAIAYTKVKTDKVDARMLADLLRMDMIPECYGLEDGVTTSMMTLDLSIIDSGVFPFIDII
jgi:hypothetical protein